VSADRLFLTHSLLKKFQKDDHLHEPKMELGTAAGNWPELSQDILMSIFCTLEIPDLLHAGSVCSSWRSAYICLVGLGQVQQAADTMPAVYL
jgi:hypothetical protein